MNKDIVKYYRDRAKEYDKVYSKPERQSDLQQAADILRGLFNNKTVLEVACGTGYWTEKIVGVASTVLATDVNDAVIEIAKHREYANANVDFKIADLYELETPTKYDALFGGFIWSHIPLQQLDGFIDKVGSLVEPGGAAVFMDSLYVHGSNHPIIRTDEYGNTYQQRKLEDGTVHEVIKNFPDEEFLRGKLTGKATNVRVIKLPYYWILIYKL